MRSNLNRLKEVNVYDDLVCADAKCLPFKKRSFDTILAIESLYCIDNLEETLKALENVGANGWVLLFSRGLRSIRKKNLRNAGYELFNVFLRGLCLLRLRDHSLLTTNDKVKFIYPLIKLVCWILRPMERDYVIAFKLIEA